MSAATDGGRKRAKAPATGSIIVDVFNKVTSLAMLGWMLQVLRAVMAARRAAGGAVVAAAAAGV